MRKENEGKKRAREESDEERGKEIKRKIRERDGKYTKERAMTEGGIKKERRKLR